MSGAGRWVKKHPMETALILGVATGGIGMLPAAAAGTAGAAGAAGGGLLGGLGAGAAAEGVGSLAGSAMAPAVFGGAEGALGAAEMAMLGESAAGPMAANGLMSGLEPMALIGNQAPEYAALNAGPFNPRTPSFMDKMQPYAKMAKEAQGLLAQNDQQQMPVAQPQGYRGQGPQLPPPNIYYDHELEKRLAAMRQSGRFYG